MQQEFKQDAYQTFWLPVFFLENETVDQSTDERYVTTIFWVSWVENTEGSEAGL